MKLPVLGQRNAIERISAGETAEVIEQLQAEVRDDPQRLSSWLQLGLVFLHIRHAKDAEPALKQAVALDDSLLEARTSYAEALSMLRRYDEAVFQLLQAKRLAPNKAPVLHQLGVAFFDKGLYEKAIRQLDEARALDPSNAKIVLALGLAHERNSNIAGAIAAFREVCELAPEWADARLTLADALASIGELASAVEQLKVAQRQERSNLAVARNLEVLQKALKALRSKRLLGKGVEAFESSTLVQRGQLKRKGVVRDERGEQVRYANDLAELWLQLDLNSIQGMTLALISPSAAASQVDEDFEVRTVARDGREVPADYGTAITLTFLREALGLPLMRASEVYRKLLSNTDGCSYGDVELGFLQLQLGDKTLHGIRLGLGTAND